MKKINNVGIQDDGKGFTEIFVNGVKIGWVNAMTGHVTLRNGVSSALGGLKVVADDGDYARFEVVKAYEYHFKIA